MSAAPAVPDSRSRDERRRIGRGRRILAISLAVAVAAGVVALAIDKIGPHRLLHSLGGVRPGWLVLAAALMILSLLLRAGSWLAVLRAVRPPVLVRAAVVARASMIGVMASAVAPGRIGEPARAYAVARRAGDAKRWFPVVIGTLVSQTVLNLVALALLAVASIASLAALRSGGAILLVLIGPAVVLALVLAGPPLLALAARSRSVRLRRASAWTRRQLVAVRAGLRVFRAPGPALTASAAQLSAWAVQVLACDAVLHALNLENKAALGAAAAVLLAINVSAAVPITPGNLGVFQAACLVVLAAYGVGAGPALAFGIVLQAVEIATALLLGVPSLAAEGLTWHDLRDHAAHPDAP